MAPAIVPRAIASVIVIPARHPAHPLPFGVDRAAPNPGSKEGRPMLHDILLVEDDPALRELIHIHLTRQLPEVHVRWVGTLSGALAAVGRLPPPQLILLDLTLPDATGLQALDAM